MSERHENCDRKPDHPGLCMKRCTATSGCTEPVGHRGRCTPGTFNQIGWADLLPVQEPEPTRPSFEIMAGHLVVAVDGCTCDGGGEVPHRPECGYEPVIDLAELAYVMQHHREDWCVFYGGPDPDNAAGTETRDDEADAREHVQWIDGSHGRGVAVRSVYYGPWRVIEGGEDRG